MTLLCHLQKCVTETGAAPFLLCATNEELEMERDSVDEGGLVYKYVTIHVEWKVVLRNAVSGKVVLARCQYPGKRMDHGREQISCETPARNNGYHGPRRGWRE